MTTRVIPILPQHALQPTRVLGDAERARPVLDALEQAVDHALGTHWPLQRWLREISLTPGEAVVTLAPDLGHDGMESAEVAFQTLRRLLPDTDIYVGAAAA